MEEELTDAKNESILENLLIVDFDNHSGELDYK